jgi:hypothetical protein
MMIVNLLINLGVPPKRSMLSARFILSTPFSKRHFFEVLSKHLNDKGLFYKIYIHTSRIKTIHGVTRKNITDVYGSVIAESVQTKKYRSGSKVTIFQLKKVIPGEPVFHYEDTYTDPEAVQIHYEEYKVVISFFEHNVFCLREDDVPKAHVIELSNNPIADCINIVSKMLINDAQIIIE